MDSKRLLDSFCEMVSIDSPSLGERKMADYLKKQLSELGAEVYEDCVGEKIGGNCGNIYAYLPGNPALAPILFSSHMDTVTPALGKRAILHKDGRITSAGDTVLGADDVSGIAAILEAIRSIREEAPDHRPIEVVFFVSEETFCHGAANFDYSRIKSKEAYVLDLTGPVGNAAYKAPTILTFTATVLGKAAHAGLAPEDGIHAVAIAAAAITKIPLGRIDENTTCNIGLVSGGTALNIIPDKCIISGEIRSYNHQKALTQADLIKKIFEDTALSYAGTAHVEVNCHLEAYETDSASPTVTRLKKVCDHLALPFALVPTFGGSDNNHITKHGISGLVLSSAMENCHSCTEFTSISELENLANLTIALIKER